jgi:predicted CopG family antitoxin
MKVCEPYQVGIVVEGGKISCYDCPKGEYIAPGNYYHMITIKNGKDTDVIIRCSNCAFKRALDQRTFNSHSLEEIRDHAKKARRKRIRKRSADKLMINSKLTAVR